MALRYIALRGCRRFQFPAVNNIASLSSCSRWKPFREEQWLVGAKKLTGVCSCRFFASPAHSDDANKPKRRVEVDYEELKSLLQDGSAIVCDVREPKELEEGKISKAINIPLCELKKALSMAEEAFMSQFGVHKPTVSDTLVFYGLRHVKGLAASEIAHKLGFKQVKHYPGGYEEWKKKQTEEKK